MELNLILKNRLKRLRTLFSVINFLEEQSENKFGASPHGRIRVEKYIIIRKGEGTVNQIIIKKKKKRREINFIMVCGLAVIVARVLQL